MEEKVNSAWQEAFRVIAIGVAIQNSADMANNAGTTW
tara:strand:+ start:939 stop:1049 length:111 start_codon:yes stop_codon:yes gene_type:complete